MANVTFYSYMILILLSNIITAGTINHDISLAPKKFQCLPCGRDCDKKTLDASGHCSECGMETVEKSTVVFKNINPKDICAYIKKHPDVLLLDVRTKAEFEGTADPNFGTLKNAINIPIQSLEQEWTSIKKYKHKDIIVFCSHSHRSPQASYFLNQQGFTKVTNMSGGMSVMTDKTCVK